MAGCLQIVLSIFLKSFKDHSQKFPKCLKKCQEFFKDVKELKRVI